MLKIKKLMSSFFFQWVTVVSICICIAILLVSPFEEILYNHNGKPSYSASNNGFFEFVFSFLLLVGLFMGFGQWIVINAKIKKAYSWILATLIGFSIGSFVSFWVLSLILRFDDKYYMVYEQMQLVGTFAGAGMFTGFCQWISLKRKLAGSLKWSLVNGMSFSIGFLLISLVSDYPVEHPIVRAISLIVSTGLVALISGYFAEPLIIRPETEDTDRQRLAS